MSSPVLNTTDFALVADAFPATPTSTDFTAQPESELLLTTRAIMAVCVLGAGFWFMLWKLALHFWMMR